MIMGSTKTCWKCRQPYQAGCVTYGLPTCEDCRIETFHVLISLGVEDGDWRASSACLQYSDWPHTWPHGQGYVMHPRQADPKRLCKACAQLYVDPGVELDHGKAEDGSAMPE